ncbi:MAG TPA: transcriptional regulator [Candidatus Saccharimonadales bacterium]|jgi:predicted transcriptional regulator
MIEQLFGSKTRVKLLQLFMSNPNRAFYVREITRKIDEQINSVRRELANLLNIGIISSQESDNKLYYEVNQKYPHYKALRSIFTNKKAMQRSEIKLPEGGVGSKLSELGSVELAVMTGRFTRDNNAGVDLLIVGDVNRTKLSKLMDELQQDEGHEIDYALFNPDEFDYRLSVKDRFVANVLESKKTVAIDTKDRVKQE